MLLSLDFMPLDQIDHMSLNGLRRRVETRDKTQTETRMGELPVALDLEHQFSTRGGGFALILFTGKSYLGVSTKLVFFSMLITYV